MVQVSEEAGRIADAHRALAGQHQTLLTTVADNAAHFAVDPFLKESRFSRNAPAVTNLKRSVGDIEVE
jgi:hypothetical protein